MTKNKKTKSKSKSKKSLSRKNNSSKKIKSLKNMRGGGNAPKYHGPDGQKGEKVEYSATKGPHDFGVKLTSVGNVKRKKDYGTTEYNVSRIFRKGISHIPKEKISSVQKLQNNVPVIPKENIPSVQTPQYNVPVIPTFGYKGVTNPMYGTQNEGVEYNNGAQFTGRVRNLARKYENKIKSAATGVSNLKYSPSVEKNEDPLYGPGKEFDPSYMEVKRKNPPGYIYTVPNKTAEYNTAANAPRYSDIAPNPLNKAIYFDPSKGPVKLTERTPAQQEAYNSMMAEGEKVLSQQKKNSIKGYIEPNIINTIYNLSGNARQRRSKKLGEYIVPEYLYPDNSKQNYFESVGTPDKGYMVPAASKNKPPEYFDPSNPRTNPSYLDPTANTKQVNPQYFDTSNPRTNPPSKYFDPYNANKKTNPNSRYMSSANIENLIAQQRQNRKSRRSEV